MTTSKAKQKHIDTLHFEHRTWTSGIRFYADELSIYQQRLDEVAGRNNNTELRKKLGHFQNQFIIQKEQLDILKHDISAHEQELSAYAHEHPVAIDHVLFAGNDALQEQYDTFVRIYAALKMEFTAFLMDRL